MRRVVLLIVLASLAFAPAPVQKPPRPEDFVAVKDVVGIWEVIELFQTGAKGVLVRKQSKFPSITITTTRWIFHSNPAGVHYDVRINRAKTHSELQLAYTDQKEPIFQGVIERQGKTIRVIYSSQQQPTSFEDPPPNCYVLTLKRK